ncbi:MAG: PAS domain S-box protein [Methanoregula sp.]|jgi:PAS domain S-box-containing protein
MTGKEVTPDKSPDHGIREVLHTINETFRTGTVPTDLPGLPDEETRQELVLLLADLAATQQFGQSLARGDLSEELAVKGRTAGCLKALQSNLRHLTWQAGQIEKGDLSQRVDFMGEFSASFNAMTDSLAKTRATRDREEEVLRRSRDYYLRLFDDFPNPIWRAGLDAKCDYFNRAWLAFTGRTLDQEKGDGWVDGVYREDLDHCVATWREAFLLRQPFSMEYRLRYHDGSYRWLLDSGKPFYAPDGTFAGYIGACYDIDYRKRTEIALAESEKRYRDMFETNNAVMLIIDPESGQIVDANAAACRYYGYTLDEIQRLLITQINIQDPEKTRADMHHAAASPGAEFRFRHKKKNGEIRDVEVFSGTVFFRGRKLLHSIIHDVTERTRAETAQKESEKQYRDLVENLSEVIVSVDREGKFTYISPVAKRLYGYFPAELTGRHFLEFVHPDDRDRVTAGFGKELAGIYLADEFRILAQDGSIRWISVAPRPIERDKGVTGFNYVMTDITGRKKAEDEERLTRERFETLVKTAEMRDASEEELAEYVMQAACRMTGSTISFIGTMSPDESVMDLISWSASVMDDCRVTVSPIHFPVRKAGIWADAIREQRPKIVNDYAANDPGKKGLPDGHVKIARLLSLPILENGNVVMIAAVANKPESYDDTDVTRLTLLMQGVWANIRRRRADDLLKNNEALLSEMEKTAQIGGWDLEVQTNNIRMTRELYRIIEIPEGEPFDLTRAIGYFDLPGRATLESAVQRCIGSGESFDLELPFATAKGRHIWTRTIGRAVKQDNKILRLNGTVQDITARKQAEVALKQINRKLTLLSSITRHDIKNQLLALKAYLELSLSMLNDPAQLEQYITQEMKAANAIERQIAFTREYENLGINAPVWQSAASCVREAVPDLPAGTIAVREDLGTVEIYADPLLGKVFYNLIDNALRYGGPKMTTIRLSCKNSGTGVTIVVEDDGAGIAAEDKKRLFERGFGHNTGLGLFLSREILSITNITIAETGEPGKGARFEIAVPEGGYRIGNAVPPG